MADIPYHMISNLRPRTTLAWRLKIRVTRIWQAIDRQGDTVGINCIFVDALGGRIHAWIPAANMNQFQNLIAEGQTYNVHNFYVRQYPSMQTYRCFENDVFIQLYHMTELSVAEDVDYIQRHVFHFTDLSAIMDAARESTFLFDVVGVLQQLQPLSTYRNKYNELKYSIELTINDMNTSAKVILYDEMAQSFNQEVHNAAQHPVILILGSVKAALIQGEPKLTNYPPTRFFINPHHEAVDDLRDAFRLVNWHLN